MQNTSRVRKRQHQVRSRRIKVEYMQRTKEEKWKEERRGEEEESHVADRS